MPKFVSTLHFSNCFILVQFLLLIGAILSVIYLPYSWWVKWVAILCVLGSSGWSLYRHFEWRSIGHDANGWYLQKAGEKFYIVPLGESTVTSFATIIRFTQSGKRFRQSYVIFKDSMTTDQYREFTVRMRYFK